MVFDQGWGFSQALRTEKKLFESIEIFPTLLQGIREDLPDSWIAWQSSCLDLITISMRYNVQATVFFPGYAKREWNNLKTLGLFQLGTGVREGLLSRSGPRNYRWLLFFNFWQRSFRPSCGFCHARGRREFNIFHNLQFDDGVLADRRRVVGAVEVEVRIFHEILEKSAFISDG